MAEHVLSVPVMRLGDTIETAWWLTGAETEAQIETIRNGLRASIAAIEADSGVMFAPLSFEELPPGAPRVPQVPAHIAGPEVRLLVAWSHVVAVRRIAPPQSFLADLDVADLERLRQITRRAHRRARPYATPLTDADCDRMIEELGPDAAAAAVREAADGRTVH